MNRALHLALLLSLVAGLGLAPLAHASPTGDEFIHTVQPGENLFRIGLKYGISWSAIMQANGLVTTYIRVGQQLSIPTGAVGTPAPSVTYVNPGSHTVVRGDTLSSIAGRYGVAAAALAAANGLAPNSWVYAGQTLMVPGGAQALHSVSLAPEPVAAPASPGGLSRGAYVVQRGDTLSRIADRYGLSRAALASANGLTTSSWVYAGQALIIPGGADALVTESAPAIAPAIGADTGRSHRIVVDISDQRLYAYQDGAPLHNFIASTGEPGRDTRPGSYSVLTKIPNAYGATWNIWMPNWLGIYWAGSLQNGIHALPILPGGGRLWDGWLGTPVSYGCVILGVWEAQTLYDWAEVGTPVIIQW